MEFLSLEAVDDLPKLQFSDDDEENITNELNSFIDDTPIYEKAVRFYRERSPLNLNYYPRLNGLTRNPLEAILSDNGSYFGEDEQTELFVSENRKNVTFDRIEGFERNVNIFKSTLLNFGKVENYLFDSVIYGLMFYKREGQLANLKQKKENAQKVLGDDLYFDLIEIAPETLLDKTILAPFDCCHKLNKVL